MIGRQAGRQRTAKHWVGSGGSAEVEPTGLIADQTLYVSGWCGWSAGWDGYSEERHSDGEEGSERVVALIHY